MDFGVAFALGLLGSLHCAAMCGPLMLALPVPPGGPARFVAGRIIYQLGRVAAYCLLGGVAGLVGKSIFLAGLQRSLSIGLGVAILLGFLFPKNFIVRAPVVRLVAAVESGDVLAVATAQSPLACLCWEGLNGLLPCGLVYVAMAGAVARGTLRDAIFFMAWFGLGTHAGDARHQSFRKIVSVGAPSQTAPLDSVWRLPAGRAVDFARPGDGHSLCQSGFECVRARLLLALNAIR